MLDFGVTGIEISVGDHICAFYEGEEGRDALLVPYLAAGLEDGDKCVAVVDRTSPCELAGKLQRPARENQLAIATSDSAYLVDGRFDTERMLGFWDERVGAAIHGDGFAMSRAVGEMTWSLRDAPGVEQLVGYESRLNDFMPRYPQVILCLYELDRFSSKILVDVLKTHPKMLLGGMVLDNPYYLEPGEFLALRQ